MALHCLSLCNTLSIMYSSVQVYCTGLLLVALVLPLRPYVEYNPPPHRPSQLLGIKGKSMENQLGKLFEYVLSDPEVTANLYCNFAYQYWESCVICSIFLR